MSDFIISEALLAELKISSTDLMIDLAVYLYDKEKATLSQAKKLASLTHIQFQKELSKRGVNIKYDVSDLEQDLSVLNDLG